MKRKIYQTAINRHGFTLVELLVVLAILVILSTVAIGSLSGVQNQTRYQATQNGLENIQDAIVGPANLRAADGSLLITGFVADTGRLPNVTVSSADPLGDSLGDPLNELIQINFLPKFKFWTSNTDPYVMIGAGWKGPYLRTPIGTTYLRDGWGNSYHAYDSSGAPASAGNPIAQISSWCANTAADTNHGGTGDTSEYNANISIPNAINLTTGGFSTTATLSGSVSMAVGLDSVTTTTPPTAVTSGPAPNSTYNTKSVAIWVCYYGPDMSSSPNPVVDVLFPTAIASDPWQYNLMDPKITIGPRVLKAYLVDKSVITDQASFRSKASIRSNFNSTTGPIFFTTSINLTVTSGSQIVPNLVFQHYSP